MERQLGDPKKATQKRGASSGEEGSPKGTQGPQISPAPRGCLYKLSQAGPFSSRLGGAVFCGSVACLGSLSIRKLEGHCLL